MNSVPNHSLLCFWNRCPCQVFFSFYPSKKDVTHRDWCSEFLRPCLKWLPNDRHRWGPVEKDRSKYRSFFLDHFLEVLFCVCIRRVEVNGREWMCSERCHWPDVCWSLQWTEQHLCFQKHQRRSLSGSRPSEVTSARKHTHTHVVVWVKVLPEWTVGLFLVCLCRGLCGFLAGREGGGATRRGGGRVPELAAGGVEGAAGASVWPAAAG